MSIKIENLTHVYMPKSPFEKKALDNVNLVIEDGEFLALIGHTGSGKSTLIQHLNIPKENTFAFGDGMNDTDMLEYCHVGIAVGNAKEGLKEIADEVCDDIAKDGIYKAMKKHQLI